MADPLDLDSEDAVEDLVDDEIIAGSDSVGVRFADHGGAPRPPGLVCEQGSRGSDPLLFLSR